MLPMIVMTLLMRSGRNAESGGSGGNFQIVVPVQTNDTNNVVYTVSVAGQTSETKGDYTVDMDFKVAMSTTPATTLVSGAEGAITQGNETALWDGTDGPPDVSVDADDETVQIKKVAEDNADEDYFLFTPASSGLLIIEANDDDDTSTKNANTKGTLFGAMETGPLMEMRTGQIATDADGGPGSHFQFAVPVQASRNYLVKVEGTDGTYQLNFELAAVEGTTITPPADTIDGTLTYTQGQTQQDKDLYLINIAESGALYLNTTGRTDVVGVLYGSDGKQIAMDDNSGEGNNFRVATNVEAGLYLLEVRGADPRDAGKYGLISNFVTGAEVEGPTTPTPQPQPQPQPQPPPDPTDPTGSLDEPPNNGSRSGIGLIRGWVCQAERVEVRITGPSPSSRTVATIAAPYGSVREQEAVDECQHNRNTIGFAAQFNYNLLEEGTYTAQARADRQTIIDTNTFDVVRISDEGFLEEASSGEIRVEDFPITGDVTILEWDESSQNFQIVDHE